MLPGQSRGGDGGGEAAPFISYYDLLLFINSATSCCQGPSVLFDARQFIPLDPTQEPIFPAALKVGSFREN